MAGRYGRDELGVLLLILSYVLLLVSLFVKGNIAALLYFLALAGLVYAIFRMFSRDVYRRRQEYYKYLRLKNNITGWFRARKTRFNQRKTQHFFRCPGCGVTVRVPKGKGKIEITCPKCRQSFIRKS